MNAPRPSSETREALLELKAEYFYCVDNKLWKRLVTLFTADATFKTGAEVDGPQHFVDVTASLFEKVHSSHYGFQPVFSAVANDGSQVRARWAMQDFLTWNPDQTRLPGVSADGAHSFHGFGYYYDLYRFDDDRWKIHSMELIRTRFDVTTSGVEVRTFDRSSTLR